ncbi:hypothetical protein Tco_0083635 [Tanacetum coccineum]
MSALKFVDSHNMVAFLAKPTECEGFEQIVDFLNANPIKYALMVNPTIYTSCIEQFWAIAKVKTVNGEVQLQALVDGKKVIITETSVRRDLQLEDAEGIECLPNADIFEQLALIGYEKPSQKLTFYKAFFSPQWKFLIHTILQCLSAKSTAWNEFSSNMASTIICLATNQKFNFSKYIFESKGSANPTDPHHTSIITQPLTSKPQKKEKPRKPKRKDIEIPQSSGPTKPIADEAANEENVPTHSNDPLLSGEDSLKLNDLMEICIKLQQRVLDLENTKTAQAHDILSLKLRVKRLEKKGESRTHKLKRLFKVGRSAQVVSSEDEGLGDQEDASKQGRKIDNIEQDAEVTLVDETQGKYDDAQMFDTDVFNGEEVFAAEQSEKVVEEVVSTAEIVVQEPVQSTTTTAPSTIPKAKSITFRDPGESTTRTTLTPIPSNIKDNGKAKMIEPEKPLKMKEQIRLDEELAFKLQAEEEE